MLGGSDNVRNLLWKHISTDNEELKSCINEWLKFLKWHQEFDWEEVAEYVLFGNSMPKLDIFWESEDYHLPEKFVSTSVWTPDRPNFADNIRHLVSGVPGFFYLADEKEALDAEKGMGQSTLDGFVTFEQKSSVSSQSGYLPNIPFNCRNRSLSESLFMRHTVWKNSSFDDAKGLTSSKNPIKVKGKLTQRKPKCSMKKTGISKKKAFKNKKITVSKRKYLKKSSQKRRKVNEKSKKKKRNASKNSKSKKKRTHGNKRRR